MTQKLKGCLMSWFNQTANISLLHSYPAITPPSLSPSHSCFLVCVCVSWRKRKWREIEGGGKKKKTWPEGIGRPCWGMITELCRIKTSLHRHTHTRRHTRTHSCTLLLGLQRSPVPVCMQPPVGQIKPRQREERGGSEENKSAASSLFLSSIAGTDRDMAAQQAAVSPWMSLYFHVFHWLSRETQNILTHNPRTLTVVPFSLPLADSLWSDSLSL